MLWTSDLVLEFIDLYKKERIIWDPKSPEYKCRDDIAMAWERIQLSMSENVDIMDLKRKKESLMTSFRFHYNRKKSSSSYQTTWFAYSAMESFLGTRYESGSKIKSENSSCQIENQFVYVTDVESYAEESILPTPQKTLTFTLKTDNKNQSDRRQIKRSPIRTATDELDEYDLYCQLLAKKFKKLDEVQRDKAMHEIDTVMFRIKMQNSSERRHQSYSASSTIRDTESPLHNITPQNRMKNGDENIATSKIRKPSENDSKF